MTISTIHDAAVSYSAVVISWVAHQDLMTIGGAMLLVARLITDVPKAYHMIKAWNKKGKKCRKTKRLKKN